MLSYPDKYFSHLRIAPSLGLGSAIDVPVWVKKLIGHGLTRRPLKKAHLLRCAQSPRSNVLPKYASARRFLARLAPGTFLTGLEAGFFKTLLERHLKRGCPEIRITAHLFPANSLESTHNS